MNHPGKNKKIFIGIGSNMGDSSAYCINSLKEIIKDNKVKLISASSLYETSAVSDIKQNDFINCAVSITWLGKPLELLRLLNSIEQKFGRIRSFKGAPRIIDLDILLYNDSVIDKPSLVVPHPELHKRKFAIIPCIEIEPTVIHPLFNKPLKQYLSVIDENQKIRKVMNKEEVMKHINPL